MDLHEVDCMCIGPEYLERKGQDTHISEWEPCVFANKTLSEQE